METVSPEFPPAPQPETPAPQPETLAPQPQTLAPQPQTPPAGGRPPRKGALGYFAVVLFLYAFPGGGAQSISAALGLAWTELFVFLLPAWAAATASNLRPREFLLLRRRPASSQVILALLCGAAAFPVANGLMALSAAMLPEPWLRTFDLSHLFRGPPLERASMALLASLLAPFCEEAAFRGYVQSALMTGRRPRAAILLAALLFAAMHLDPVRFAAVLALGALFGWLAWRAGSLWPAVAAHAANNALAAGAALSAGEEGTPAGPEMRLALLLLAAGALLLGALTLAYARATPSPPPAEALLARRNEGDPSVRFRWSSLAPQHLAAGALGLVLLLGLAAFAGARP